jgi:hypothetical protein
MHHHDLTGLKFGFYRVLERAESVSAHGHARWLCQCACGAVKAVDGRHLRSGRAQSCGCRKAELIGRRARRHGHHINGRPSPTYASWTAMMHRCTCPTAPDWKRYGGRGVSVTERWYLFENFLADMGIRPEGRTLDRHPDPAGNYEPGNVRWATVLEQRLNRRPPR